MVKSDYINIKLTEVHGNSKFKWFFMWTTHEQYNYIQKHQLHICLYRIISLCYSYKPYTSSYIYIHTNFVLLLWDLSNCGIKPANANEITLCLYSFKYVSFLRGLKQLGVIGTSSRTAYFLRNGKLAEPMQHALQLSADIPTAVWWQPEYEDTLHGPKNSGQTLPRPHWAHGYSQKRTSQHCVATFEPNMIQRSSV